MSFVNKVQKAAWDSLISYKTQRIILIKDFKLGVFHKSLLIGVGIYLIYTILTSHAYMIKESPATTINSWVDGTEFLRKLNETKAGTRSEPWYCDDSTVEYVYSPSFTYLDNKCDLESNVAEVFDEESTAVSFVTYYQVRDNDGDIHSCTLIVMMMIVVIWDVLFSPSFLFCLLCYPG